MSRIIISVCLTLRIMSCLCYCMPFLSQIQIPFTTTCLDRRRYYETYIRYVYETTGSPLNDPNLSLVYNEL